MTQRGSRPSGTAALEAVPLKLTLEPTEPGAAPGAILAGPARRTRASLCHPIIPHYSQMFEGAASVRFGGPLLLARDKRAPAPRPAAGAPRTTPHGRDLPSPPPTDQASYHLSVLPRFRAGQSLGKRGDPPGA